METSSPLAAMRPTVPMFGQSTHFTSQPLGGIDRIVGLDLRERMHKPKLDYFNVKSVRGSSPAASLAADLCQNFRIDSDARSVLQPYHSLSWALADFPQQSPISHPSKSIVLDVKPCRNTEQTR
jgi:hypothetical protein